MATRTPPGRDSLRHVAAVIKCLGHPLRLRLLQALEHRELSVSQLQAATGADQATVSRQLAILRRRHVVDCRREGLNVFYRIIEPRVHKVLDCIRSCDLDG
jgi:DNA-binding transcriptional ArsR family regulator